MASPRPVGARLAGFALIAAVSTFASCDARNLDGVCQLAKDILAEPRNTPADRLPKLLAQRSYFAHGAAGDALDAALAAPKPQRYEAFLTVATSKVEGWKCSALEAVLEAPEVD